MSPVPHCPNCGMAYRDFRTGETFATVRQAMRVGSSDPSEWRYKRRKGVLGAWCQLKRELWKWHLNDCRQEDTGHGKEE